ALFFVLFQGRIFELNRQVREINSRISGSFNEGITGAKTIKTLVIEKRIDADFMRETGNMYNKSVAAARQKGLFTAVTNFATSVGLAIVLWKGGVIARTEVGTFALFMSYVQGIMEPVRYLVESLAIFVMGKVNISRFAAIVEAVSSVTDSPEVIEKYGDSFNPRRENWEPLHGDIEFENVDFKYPDGDEYVLENFSLRIPFGTHLAIVGETGAGKSTLVNLVCRFFEPTKGRVLIDGRDARERSQLWLHSSLGYVLQTPHLFSGTVRENLLYGNPGASDGEIYAALDLVCARELVGRLGKGLDSDVGEGGDLLSAGEKQLLSFARAILADPKILVLDEATAS
ncbi:MAG TPA: ABC transporter ATP-binding protein, partial [Bacillota bacterium]|nr:ABC transporter ATP-binding protein [Bacillota bacterium]